MESRVSGKMTVERMLPQLYWTHRQTQRRDTGEATTMCLGIRVDPPEQHSIRSVTSWEGVSGKNVTCAVTLQ